MPELQPQSHVEQIRLNAERQAEAIKITPIDLNERGERYAVVGGATSELPEHLWRLVRTDAFKEWYGDWEHTPVEQFQTAQGSVYLYDREGHTTRFKTAAGERHDRQDITVFADLSLDEEQDFLAAYRTEGGLMHDGKRVKVYVTEKLEDGTGKVVRKREEVGNQSRLALAILNGHQNGKFTANNVVQAKRASLQPAEGLNTFDTRHYEEGGTPKTERHLGNKVVKIDYSAPETPQLLKKGEPHLLKDPHSTDESGYCFVRMLNPMKMDRQAYIKWSEQFGEGEEKRDRIMAALHQQGHDGLFIDGQPAPFFEDEQLMRVKVT